MNRFIFLISIFALLLPFHIYSQNLPDSINVEAGFLISGGRNVPFWLLSNRYGIIDNSAFNGWIRASIFSSLHKEKKFDYAYGIDLYNIFGDKYHVVLHQAYIDIKYSFLVLEGGKKEEIFGNQDTVLSSGGILWSGNAPVMPRVALRTDGFVTVPFTGNLLYFNGGISHSWLGDNQYTEKEWLHHKYFYVKTTDRFPIVLSAGLQHFVQWGGVSRDTAVGKLPSDIHAFLDILTGKSGSENSPVNEKLNALGNHLGSYNVRLDARIKKFAIGIYWQSIFEDKSGLKLRNSRDGLWGYPCGGVIPDYCLLHLSQST